ncbi:unnamed protein product [Polarella glacialis]|uniref:Uncharacterized protein n=1 Tax=Polarella glacialis TaxID=89957 RepID=A0A813GSV6_POLGL|nr:unnamed protein product [Polarella glacialis]CAE8628536.1 unnamed protein product [Polarella glacialis]
MAVNSRPVLLVAGLVCVCLAGSLAFVSPAPPAGASRDHRFLATSAAALPPAGAAEQANQADVKEADALGGALRVLAAVCAALMVALVPLQGAEAARSGGRMGGGGGRMGGSSFRARPSPPRQAMPQGNSGARMSSGPNIHIGVAPPMYGYGGGFGGFGMPFGGFGMPFGGFGMMNNSGNDQMLQNQQRRDESQLDGQKGQIADLEKQIAELKASKQ